MTQVAVESREMAKLVEVVMAAEPRARAAVVAKAPEGTVALEGVMQVVPETGVEEGKVAGSMAAEALEELRAVVMALAGRD